MANEERVVFIAEVRDEATASLDDINKSIDDTTKRVDDAGKKTEQSTGRMTTAFDRFSKGGSSAFQRFSGGMRTHLDRGMGALGDLHKRVSESDNVFGRFVRGGTRGLQDFASGFKSPMAAVSSFTGRLGTIGGFARKGVDALGGIGRALGPAASAAGSVASGIAGVVGSAVSAGAAIASNIGSAIADGVVNAGKLAGILGGLVVGESLRGGLARAMNIEDAEARMRGMGYATAEITELMTNASDAIMGTAFRLDDAATTAAQFSAAGVSAGEDMERVIGLVGDSAFAAGTDFNNMSEIWAQVAARGRLDGQTMNRLLAAGVGITGELADKFGVADEEVQKLVSEGSVSFEDFAEVMETKVGGAAQEMAETTRGAIMNVQAGLHMVGAEVAGPFMQMFRGAFNALQEPLFAVAAGVTPIFEALTENTTEWADTAYGAGERVAESITAAMAPMEDAADLIRDGVPLFEAMATAFDMDMSGGLGGFLATIGDTLKEFSPLIGAAAGGVLALMTQFGRFIPIIGRFLPVFNPIFGIIVGLIAGSSELREALGGALATIGDALMELAPILGEALNDLFAALGPVIASVVTMLADTIAMLAPVLAEILPVIAELAGELISSLAPILPVIADSFSSILTAVLPLVPLLLDLALMVITPLIGLVSTLVPLLVEGLAWAAEHVIVPAVELLAGALEGVIGWLVGLGDETTTQGAFIVTAWDWIVEAVLGAVTWFTETALPWMIGFWDGIVAAAVGFWEFVQPILTGFVDAWIWVAQLMMTIYLTVILVVFNLLAGLVTWIWENILQPFFQWVVDGFIGLGNNLLFVWENIIKPVFDFFGTVITWLWENVIQPYFQQMGESFQRLGSFFVLVWEEYLQPAINWLGDLFMWLWTDVIQPVIGWVIERWQIMAETMALFYVEHIRPLIQRFGEIMTGLYNNYISPAIGWIMDRWHGLAEGLSNIWTQNIRPVLDRVGEFFTETIPGWVQTGVDIIAGIWDTVTGIFAVPINWVLENVWNKGIVAAFNKAADTVGFSGRLEEAGMIGSRGGSAGGSATSGRGGGAAFAAARAEGGPVSAGVPYLVGEEGPEVITPSRSGWVHTADETRNMLGTDAPGGLGIGAPTVGATSQIATWFATSDNAAAEWGRDKAGNLVQWVRGKAADAFSAVMEPLVDSIQESRVVQGSGRMGGLAGAYIDYGVGKVAEWLRGKDDEHNAAAAAAGFSDEPFTANPGGFNRPAQGIISSRAGRRAYQGAFGGMHYGVDIANAVGTIVRAAWSGVVRSTSGGGLNRTMVLSHGGFDTAYMHNSGFLASPGEQVTGGQPIARMGSAGTGPHLHFEVHPGGYYNPSIAGVNALFDDGGILGTGTTIAQNNTGLPEFVFTNQRFGQVEDALDYVSANLPMPSRSGSDSVGGAAVIDRRTSVTIENIQIDAAGGDLTSPEVMEQLREAIEEIFEESERRDY